MAKRKTIRKNTVADDHAKSRRVAREAKLIQISFQSCYAHRSFLLNAPLPQQIKTVVDANILIDREVGLLIRLEFKIEGRLNDAPDVVGPAELPLLIAAAIELQYSVESLQSIPHDEISAFSQRTSVAQAWPYWREYVSSATARMGLPAMTIPLVNNVLLKAEEVQ